MTTLFDILKNAYFSLGQLEETTATGGSVSTVVDTKLVDKYGDNDLVGGTIFVIHDAAGASAAPEGEAHTILSNDEATQTITVDTNFTASISAGDTIGIANNVYPLYTLIEAVNRALSNLGTIQLPDTSLTTVASQNEYTIPLALKYKQPVRVQVQTLLGDSDSNYFMDVENWYTVPAAPGTTGLLIFRNELPAGYTIKLWYEAEHPKLFAMTDKLSETIHSELANALVVEKALQWQNDRQSGQNTYDLQRLNKAGADLDEARRMFNPQKERSIKYLVPGRKQARLHSDITKAEL